ncbi:MAG: hypothetical protein EOO06_20935 [Chitinophagaceae bacterium]|nr:MAG: hypothetical protein EOO06_20935 [Chitinophagaceae bacterium]
MESTFNSGKQYINDNIIDKPTQCYGYDQSAFYGVLLGAMFSDLKIPTNEGKAVKLNNIDFANLEYGIYNIRITSDIKDVNKRCNKIFAFNPRHWYTHYCVQFAYEHREELGFKLELLHSHNHNAYIYDKMDITYSSNIFGDWFKHLTKFKHLSKESFNKAFNK